MAVGEAGRFMEHVVTKEPYSTRRSPRWAGVEGLDGCGVQSAKLSWQPMAQLSWPCRLREGMGFQTLFPPTNLPFGVGQHGKWGEGGPIIGIEILSLYCGVAYAMVGRCNPTMVAGEAGRSMEHAVTNGVDQRGRAGWVRCPACWFSWLSAEKAVGRGRDGLRYPSRPPLLLSRATGADAKCCFCSLAWVPHNPKKSP